MTYQSNNQAVALRDAQPPAEIEVSPGLLTVQEIKAQVQLIQEVMQAVMQEGFHYGTLPGTDKPCLLKSGAEKLTTTFRLAPKLHITTREIGAVHREYEVRCELFHIPTGRSFGEGVGSCSTLESRYRWRTAERVCPQCGRSTIIKGKAEYGGGWLCFQKKGGCGAKFTDHDPALTSQEVGRVENPDIADIYNTVLKMAKKRALIDATLTATAASDIFTQDLDDNQPPDEALQRPDPVGGDRPLRTQSKPDPSQQSGPTPPYPFQPDTLYVGTITQLTPVIHPDKDKQTNRHPGTIEIATAHGPLMAFFWERPPVLKKTTDWKPLIGMTGSVVFEEKLTTKGDRTVRVVKEFEIATPPAASDQPGLGNA